MSVRRVAAGAEEESTNGQVANTGTRTWAGQVQGSSGRRTGITTTKMNLFLERMGQYRIRGQHVSHTHRERNRRDIGPRERVCGRICQWCMIMT